jgi:hypothetical protein
MGVDIAYVSDYVDNHQQMKTDLKVYKSWNIYLFSLSFNNTSNRVKESEPEFRNLEIFTENLLKNSTHYEENRQQIRQNMDSISQRWHKLNRTVDNRIVVSSDYLKFIKSLNQFRNLALDLQELFKTAGLQNLASSSMLEQHVQEKLKSFEKLYADVMNNGTHTIELLRKVLY